MVRVGLMALLLLVAGCSAGDGSEPSDEEPPESAGASEELRVMRISSEEPGQGPQRPRVVVAPSASALSEAIGASVPESGSGTYLAAYWGEKPTGGYSMSGRSARLEGDRVTVRLSLEEPPRDAILTQALTYPHTIAMIQDLSPEGKAFSFADERGRELDWPIRRAGG